MTQHGRIIASIGITILCLIGITLMIAAWRITGIWWVGPVVVFGSAVVNILTNLACHRLFEN